MNLTQEQQLIVAHAGGHAKVSAVAGSGKTSTMVARVRHLLKQGVPAHRIMVLMFNRSARDAFSANLTAVLKPTGLAPPEVRTFHSLGLRLIQSFCKRGALPVRTLLTADYQVDLLAKEAVKQAMEQDDDSRDWLAKDAMEGFLTFIDLVKANTRPPTSLFDELGLDDSLTYFIKAFEIFEQIRTERRVRFYADLIHEPVMAILADTALAQWVGNHVDHIIVDEYQDINEVQQQLLKAIAGSQAKVMVVGDVDQCIYEWRGARPEYINERFQHDFANPANFTLSYTFRFGHQLSLAANYLIHHNHQRDRKLCRSFPGNSKTQLDCQIDDTPHPILSILIDWQNQGRSLSEAAALVRMFAMSVPLELALMEAAIPYHLLGHERVFECPEIMALTGFLKLCHGGSQFSLEIITAMLSNPHLGLKRVHLEALARDIAHAPHQAPELILSQVNRDTPPFIKRQIEERAVAWKEIQQLPAKTKAHELLSVIINKTGLFDFYHSFSSRLSQAENRIKTCQAYVSFAQRVNLPIANFLDHIDHLQQRYTKPDGESLLITSIHRAKGLEWPLVILPGLTDGSFPILDDTLESMLTNFEDERRLFYVAMTRARERLIFIHPHDQKLLQQQQAGASRFIPPIDNTAPLASRFLYESNLRLSGRLGDAIDADLSSPTNHKDMEIPPATPQHPPSSQLSAVDYKVANAYLAAIDSPLPRVKGPTRDKKVTGAGKGGFLKIEELAEGLMVHHQTFGTGVVTAVPNRRQGKVKILFEGVGSKVLIADMAKLVGL